MSNAIQFFEQPDIVPLNVATAHLHAQDSVAIAKKPLHTAMTLGKHGTGIVSVQQFIPSGHKVALINIDAQAPIYRYGQIIGFATQPITAGEHVHTHNMGMGDFQRDYQPDASVRPVKPRPMAERRTYQGFQREDGRVGTRNYVAVISSVNCSAHTCREIARHFAPEVLRDTPNVDGVIALTHAHGCASQLNGYGYHVLQRTLAGMARHPNIAAHIWVGLGCETNQIDAINQNHGLNRPAITIQETGGVRRTIQAGIEAVEALLPFANSFQRSPQPISELTLALQCGGSDSWSGITANPLVGHVADEVVHQGGTVVLGETPEIYGAEHLLLRRAVNEHVAEKLVQKIQWWENHTRLNDMEIDNNPTVGNKAGGLTTIYEKSLGAVAKGGSTPLTGVFNYAESITTTGFTVMDTPGYDPVSVTGQVAGGCNLVLFTGRGSAFGFKPAPSIKISSNSQTYQHMDEDMDFDAGQLLNGANQEDMARDLLNLVIAVASGQPSKSEAQGIGETEFAPWHIGATM